MVAIAAGVASATAAVGGAVEGGMKSGGSSSSQSSAPWRPQQASIENAYNIAQNAYSTESAVPYPTSFVAQQNQEQANATNNLYQYGMDSQAAWQPWGTAGNIAANMMPTYITNAQGVVNNGIGAQSPSTNILANYASTGSLPGESSVNPALSQSVTNGATGAVGSLNYGQQAASAAAQAALNPNGALNAGLAGASAYVNNPTLNSAIQAANYQTNLGLTENTLPQIRQAAMNSGNANSSREGALEGIATQSASANMANTAAQMESNAYNTGAQLGESGYLQSLNTAVGAGNALTANGTSAGNLLNTQQGLQQQNQQFGVSSQLGAANSAASQDLNYQTANTSAQLAGNSQLGSSLSMGLQDSNAAYQAGLTGLQTAQAAGGYEQNQAQQAINNTNDAYNFLTNEPTNLLNNYWNVVGNKQGSNTNATTIPNNGGLGGALSGAIGGGTTAYGFLNNLGLTGGSGDGSSNGGFGDNTLGGLASNTGSGSSSFGNWLSGLFGGGSGSGSGGFADNVLPAAPQVVN